MAAAIADAIEEQPAAIEVDGYLYDTETGELLGPALKQGFVVDSNEAADWVLGKMVEKQARLAALQKAVERETKQLESLHKRFDEELEHFAKQKLEGLKERSLHLSFGALSFRASKGTNKITDMDAAVCWADEHRPEIVKVSRSVGVSDLLVEAERAGQALPFIDSTGPKENFSISLNK
jgi:hypothetical protein